MVIINVYVGTEIRSSVLESFRRQAVSPTLQRITPYCRTTGHPPAPLWRNYIFGIYLANTRYVLLNEMSSLWLLEAGRQQTAIESVKFSVLTFTLMITMNSLSSLSVLQIPHNAKLVSNNVHDEDKSPCYGPSARCRSADLVGGSVAMHQ